LVLQKIIADRGRKVSIKSQSSAGFAINNSGHVTGYSATIGNGAQHAFFYDGSTMQDLGTLGGSESFGTSINASARPF
jgi:probable HAF family extracellular repeat protein